MNKESPITEFIIDPICKKIFNSIKIKEKGFGQLTLISLVFCVYYLLVDNIDRSSIFYVLSYLFFYIYNKKVHSNDNDMLYFLTNLSIIILVFKSKNFDISSDYMLLSLIIIILCYLSYCIKTYYITNDSKWNTMLNNVAICMYPNNDKTKVYHYNKFWNIFDFSFFSLYVYIIISALKKNEIY